MTNPRTQDLTTGSISHHLLRLSVPMIWGIMAIVSMQLVDMYYVSQIGHLELEAISFTFPISMMVFNLVMGLSIATSAICARLIGQKAGNEMKHFIAHALMIATAFGVFLALLGEILLPFIFQRLGAESEHMPLILSFMRISLWGYVFITIPLVANAALRAAGDTLIPSFIMLGAALINIPLSWALIFGHCGFPALGIAGAATANVIANAGTAIFALYVLIVRNRMLDRQSLNLNQFGSSFRRLMMIAAPVGLMNLIQPLSAAVITAMLAKSGAEAVAAYAITARIEAVAAVVLMAVSIGMSPIIGQNYGAKKFDRIEKTIEIAIKFCVLWSSITALILMLFSTEIAKSFTTDPTTIHIVARYFLITGITGAIANIAMGWGTAWNALGKPQLSFIMTIGRFIVGNIMFGSLGFYIHGWSGLFTGIAVGNLVIGLFLHFWSVHQFHKMKKG